MQSSLASVSKTNGNSKFGKDKMFSILVSSNLRVERDFLASSDSIAALSVLFRCLFNGDAIFANPFMNLR